MKSHLLIFLLFSFITLVQDESASINEMISSATLVRDERVSANDSYHADMKINIIIEKITCFVKCFVTVMTQDRETYWLPYDGKTFLAVMTMLLSPPIMITDVIKAIVEEVIEIFPTTEVDSKIKYSEQFSVVVGFFSFDKFLC